jgi:membrane protease YdiL (CAAX protease family)
MDQFTVERWAGALQVGVLLASVIAWLQIAAWWRRRVTVVEYQPRSAVPWGPVAILPAVAFMLMALLSESARDSPPPKALVEDPWHTAQQLMAAMLMQVMMASLVIGIAAVSHATLRDLGIIPTTRQVARDIGIGAMTFLAAVAPVHFVQARLLVLTEQKELSNNPLIKMVTSGEPQLGIFILATIAAVVVAPICEEILYRLVLQGWLEKWEDQRLGWREATMPSQLAGDNPGIGVNPRTAEGSELITPTNPPKRGVAGLPYGCVPILISSALFGAAHYGYGPEPVPIFLLAIVLGYVYQRTHRIIPCIVAHSLFNSLTMITLWGLKLKE